MKTKKILALALCAVLLVGGSVLGTMAYLTDQAKVENTFSVGNVDISLDEAKVDENGKATDAARVTENSYKLLPGHEYDKDPTIHVAEGSEDCWLFVKVENGISTIEADPTIAAQMTANGWTLVAGYDNVYAYKEIVSEKENVVVFSTFTLAGNADVADYAGASITVTAYAVQADGFTTSAAAIAAAPFPTTTP